MKQMNCPNLEQKNQAKMTVERIGLYSSDQEIKFKILKRNNSPGS